MIGINGYEERKGEKENAKEQGGRRIKRKRQQKERPRMEGQGHEEQEETGG
jgi:hypothetical protein